MRFKYWIYFRHRQELYLTLPDNSRDIQLDVIWPESVCAVCVCVCLALQNFQRPSENKIAKFFSSLSSLPLPPNPFKLTLWISKQLHAFNAITLLHFFVCHCNSFIPHSWAAVVELKSVSFAVLHLISQYFARCTRTHEQTEEKRSYGDDKPKTCIPSPVRNHRACVVLFVSPHVNRTPTRLTKTVFALSNSTRACSSFSKRQQQHQHFDSILIPFAHHFLMASFFNSEPFLSTSFSSLFRGIDVSWKRFQRYTFRSICCVCVCHDSSVHLQLSRKLLVISRCARINM